MRLIPFSIILGLPLIAGFSVLNVRPGQTFNSRFFIKDDRSTALSSLAKESPVADRALDSALDFLQKNDAEEDEDDEFDMFDIFEESPELDIPYDLIAELEEKEARARANRLPSGRDVNRVNIQGSMSKWRRHEGDSGSPEAQVAIANEKIKYLTKHLLANKNDIAARRGLNALVNLRRTFLNYLFRTDKAKAEEMISTLGIRFRAPGRLWDKEAKYGAFKNTKSKWLKIRVEKRQLRDSKVSKFSKASV